MSLRSSTEERYVPVPSSGAQMRAAAMQRPLVKGKFLFVGDEKFLARGVTYGPFRPNELGCAYHDPEMAHRDFAAMAAHGINSIRTYTCPPRWLLDVAADHNLRVMAGVGLAGEQLVTFLDHRKTVRGILRRCADEIRACAGHPALLAYSVGNEIPSTIVRWHGRRRVEGFLGDLCDIVRARDPEGLVTYVNYPTTEYLQLPFLDFVSYNVYLESPDRFELYLDPALGRRERGEKGYPHPCLSVFIRGQVYFSSSTTNAPKGEGILAITGVRASIDHVE